MLSRAAFCVLITLGFSSVCRAQPTVLEIKHEAPLLAIAWSSDGKRVASADQNGVIRISEHPSAKEVIVLNAGAPVNGVVFSKDGKLLGIKSGGMDGPLSVWDTGTGKKLKQLAFKGYTCSQIAFTDDGQTLIASGPGENMVWHHAKGGGSGSKSAKVPDGSSAAVSPGGTIIAWSNPAGLVQFFHVAERKFQRMQLGPTVAFVLSPDERLLAAAAPDKTIRLWAFQGSELRKLDGLREPATLLHFSSNGKLLVAGSSGDPTLRIWDVETTQLRRRVTIGAAGPRALALSPDGLNVAVANGNKLQIWNVATRDLGELGKAKALSPMELATAWEQLAGGDPNKAETAFRALASAQEHAVAFLEERIRSIAVPAVDWKRIEQSLADLDDVIYAKRERAMLELAKQGEYIQPTLEKYLESKPSPEGEKRASRLLQRLIDPELTPDRLRCLEAIEILELLNTPQSRSVLDGLARDALLAQVRVAARDARDRLRNSSP